jgi:hypothetical protein
MPSVKYSKGASASEWENQREVITDIWVNRAKNVDELVTILQKEHNFRTTYVQIRSTCGIWS